MRHKWLLWRKNGKMNVNVLTYECALCKNKAQGRGMQQIKHYKNIKNLITKQRLLMLQKKRLHKGGVLLF